MAVAAAIIVVGSEGVDMASEATSVGGVSKPDDSSPVEVPIGVADSSRLHVIMVVFTSCTCRS